MLERWIPLLSFSKKPLYLCLIVGMWRWGLLDYSVRSLGSTGKWYLYNTMRNWIAKKGRGVDISVRYFDNFCKKKKKKKRNKNRINPPSLKVLSKTIDLHLFSTGFYGWLVWRHFDQCYKLFITTELSLRSSVYHINEIHINLHMFLDTVASFQLCIRCTYYNNTIVMKSILFKRRYGLVFCYGEDE